MVAPLVAIAASALTPFVKDLFANGLSMLGKAIASKGKAVVEEKLGVKLPDDSKPLTPEQVVAMQAVELAHMDKLEELAAGVEIAAIEGVTKRWEADMLSDSWLSKNIRPLALIHTLLVFDLLLIAALLGKLIPDGYLSLVASLLSIMVTSYFVGRSVEKAVDVYQGWKTTKGN